MVLEVVRPERGNNRRTPCQNTPVRYLTLKTRAIGAGIRVVELPEIVEPYVPVHNLHPDATALDYFLLSIWGVCFTHLLRRLTAMQAMSRKQLAYLIAIGNISRRNEGLHRTAHHYGHQPASILPYVLVVKSVPGHSGL